MCCISGVAAAACRTGRSGRPRTARCCDPTDRRCGRPSSGPRLPLAAKRPLDGGVVALQVRVAVQHEERVAEQRAARCRSAPPVPRRPRAVEDVAQAHAPAASRRRARRAPSRPDSPTQNTTSRRRRGAAAARAGARRTAARRPPRAPSGSCSVSGPQPRGQAAGENGDRQAHREQHLRALEVEAEAHFLEAGLRHRRAQPAVVLGVEQQEAAAAGADELAADRAVLRARARTTRRSAGCSCRRSAASCAPSARASARRSSAVSPVSSACWLRRPSSLT